MDALREKSLAQLRAEIEAREAAEFTSTPVPGDTDVTDDPVSLADRPDSTPAFPRPGRS